MRRVVGLLALLLLAPACGQTEHHSAGTLTQPFPAVVSLDSSTTFYGPSFVTPRRGFLGVSVLGAGERVLETDDGGVTFNVNRRSPSVFGIERTRAHAWFAFRRDRVVVSRDGGGTWRVKPGFHLPACTGGVSVVDLRHAFADQSKNCGSGSNSGDAWLIRSRDGGRTWARIPTPRCYRAPFRAFSFVDERVGYLACDEGIGTSLGPQVVYRTADGGEHWRRVGMNRGGTLNEIEFLDRSHGFMLTARGGISITTNGGHSWRLSFADRDKGGVSMNWPDKRNGYAACFHDGLFRTRDGGRTWRRVFPRPASRNSTGC